MLFHSISLFAILASTALAAPTSPQTYSDNIAPVYNTNGNTPYTTIHTLHTDVYHWTALMNTTRDSYKTCTTDEERAIYTAQLQSQFTSLQGCVDTAQTYFHGQDYSKNNNGGDKEEGERYVNDVRDCVQEIRYTGQGLIPILGHDVVAPLLIGVVKSLNGLLGVLLPLVGGLLEVVFELLAGLLDLLF